METGLIIKPKTFDNYVVVPSEIFRDNRLTLGAVGLYCYLLSHKSEFQISLEFLSNAFQNKISSVRHRIKELEQYQYLKRKRVTNDKGHLVGYNYIIQNPTLENPTLEKPYIGKSLHRENHTQSNINNNTISNTNSNNNSNTLNNKSNNKVKNELVLKSYAPIVELFPETYRPKNAYQKNKWIDCIDKLDRIDGYSPRKVYYIIKKARADEFWKTNFYSLLKLRHTNKQGVKFIDIFFEKFASELKGMEL